jgi:trehalose 6-phosphate phosphatase
MTESAAMATIRQHLRAGGSLALFLDYDGTLVPIAPTPAEAQPDKALLDLLADLAHASAFDTIILSGRPLSSLQALLPVPGLTLAGTYGVEVQREGKVMVLGVAPDQIRPVIAQVKEAWERVIDKRDGFLLEDKGLAIALHARWADPGEANSVLERAQIAATAALPADHFRILGGDRFLEVAPASAHKGQTVDWLLARSLAPNALPVYFGDDDKDEEAFSVIRRHGGIPIGVGTRFPLTLALEHIPSPETLRDWLRKLLEVYGEQ